MVVENSYCFLEQLDGCEEYQLFLGSAGWLWRIITVSWNSWMVVTDSNCFLEQLVDVQDSNCFLEQVDGCGGF